MFTAIDAAIFAAAGLGLLRLATAPLIDRIRDYRTSREA